jgi:hypothetical protein
MRGGSLICLLGQREREPKKQDIGMIDGTKSYVGGRWLNPLVCNIQEVINPANDSCGS